MPLRILLVLIAGLVLPAQALELAARDAARDLILELEPSDLLAPGYRAEAIRADGVVAMTADDVRLWRGQVRGEQDSLVRLSEIDGALQGIVRSGGRWLGVVRPAPGRDAILELAELDLGVELGSCAVDASGAGISSLTLPATGAGPRAAGGLRELELATQADYEYTSAYGGAAGANSRILALLNEVDGLYEAELGLSIKVTHSQAWETSADPYTTSSAEPLLYQLQDYGNANLVGVARDTVHLFTGRDLQSSVIGIAYLSATCRLSYAYGLSQDLSILHYSAITAAHEIGHNLSAVHDPFVSCPLPAYVMAPALQSCTEHFSSASRAQIDNWVLANGSCFTLAGAAPSLTLAAPYGPYAAGARLRVEVTTAGDGARADAYVLVVAPNGAFASVLSFNRLGPIGAVLPYATNLPISAGTGVVLDLILPPLPAGQYGLYAILAQPGTPTDQLLAADKLLSIHQLTIAIQ
jgi:hypothetical protein